MLTKLFRRQKPAPIRLPMAYHWERYPTYDTCVRCGRLLPGAYATLVAWTRPKEAEPRSFGPVGVCCALRFAPWPDVELVDEAVLLDCQCCGAEMSLVDHGVDEKTFCPWFQFVCDGGMNPDEGVTGCGHRVRLRFQQPTATLML